MNKLYSVYVIGRLWMNKNGNTYHTSQIIVNGQNVHKTDKTYGYGDQFLSTAEEWLIENNYISSAKDLSYEKRKESGIIYGYESTHVTRKKDL